MKTVLYYTSSHEDPEFEARIIDDLVSKARDYPIISVSQLPLNLGTNVCVGDVGISYVNEWRQILIGARLVTTPYIILAESDFLYPPEYFSFAPMGGNAYKYDNVWIVWKERFDKARRKVHSEGAMIVEKTWYVGFLERFLAHFTGWYEGWVKLPPVSPFELFHGEQAAISFKTGNGTRQNTNTLDGPENRSGYLTGWGSIRELRDKFL